MQLYFWRDELKAELFKEKKERMVYVAIEKSRYFTAYHRLMNISLNFIERLLGRLAIM